MYHQSKQTNSKQLTNKQTNLLIAPSCQYNRHMPYKSSFEYHLKTPFLDILLIFSNYVAVLSPKYKLLPIFVYLIIYKSMSIHADLNRSSVFMFQIKTNWRFLFRYNVPFTCTKRGVIALKTKIQRKGARKVFLCSDVLKLT